MDGAERKRRFEREVEAMLRDGRMDGIVRVLEGQYPRWQHLVEDAVFGSVLQLLATAESREIDSMVAFLTLVAKRRLLRAIKRARLVDDVDPDGDMLGSFGQAELNEVAATVRMLKEKMQGWTESVRVVTSLVLDALMEDYPLTSGELARDASAILGRNVTADECRTWKSRGLRMLREILMERGTGNEEE